ncbi:hypothetical protein YC2023_019056 [Brassica napus]
MGDISQHTPRFTWDCIREVGTLVSKVGIWMVRSCYKDHERIGQLWWWLLRLWRWDECGMIWRLVEHNGWYNVGSSIENCLMLMKFQVFLDYERFHTFRRLGYIIKWMVVRIWICLLHILAFLAQIPNRGYKELGNKVICSDVIESGISSQAGQSKALENQNLRASIIRASAVVNFYQSLSAIFTKVSQQNN